MIVDACTFSGEWEMLVFRIRVLRQFVDRFVVVQGDRSFSGVPRDASVPAGLLDRLGLGAMRNRISFHTAVLEADGDWEREYQQRDAIRDACREFSGSDIVVVGDVDEIPACSAYNRYRLPGAPLVPKVCRQAFFYYDMTNLREEVWCGSIFATMQKMRELTPQGLRHKRNVWPGIEHAGWHFSYFGSAARIQEKLRSFAHQEYNCAPYTDAVHIEACRESGEDLFGRGTNVRRVDASFFPDYIVREAQTLGWL